MEFILEVGNFGHNRDMSFYRRTGEREERGDGYLFQMVVLPLKILRKRWLK